MRRIDGQWRQHRQHMLLKILFKLRALFVRQRLIRGHDNSLLGELRQYLFFQTTHLFDDHRTQTVSYLPQLLAGSHAVR